MEHFILLFVFIFGMLIGSFLNVIIYRYNTGLSFAKGRSQCFVCGKTLAWYELIPVLSFVFQNGRCRGCKSKISWQYPVVELASALLFVCVVIRQISLYHSLYAQFSNGILYSFLFVVYYCIVTSLLIVIAAYDIRHMIIPDGLIYTFITLAFAKLILFWGITGFSYSTESILNLFAPFIIGGFFAALWAVSRGMWVGFGDAKLGFGIGALVGLTLGVSAVMLGFWIGALFSILLLIQQKVFGSLGKPVGMKTEIPFAPFLIIGVLIVLFAHINVFDFGQIFYG